MPHSMILLGWLFRLCNQIVCTCMDNVPRIDVFILIFLLESRHFSKRVHISLILFGTFSFFKRRVFEQPCADTCIQSRPSAALGSFRVSQDLTVPLTVALAWLSGCNQNHMSYVHLFLFTGMQANRVPIAVTDVM